MAMQVPDTLLYSTDHEWADVTGPVARVGITDYAQDALGDVVFVDLPKVGTVVAVGDTIGEVESTKSVSEIYAPLAGTITAVNDNLVSAPEAINASPYGEGWLCEITLDGDGGASALLAAAAYLELTTH